MRVLVHLSDLHFGRVDQALLAPLVDVVARVHPDLVAVSGDLTQRAKSEQFREARRFLDALPSPQVIVPGNHDVPLHNVFRRVLQPLDNYRRYITPDLAPFHADDEIAVIGINTARSMTIKSGRVNDEQLAGVHSRFSTVGPGVTKIVVTHHPFDLPVSHGERQLVGRARMAMATFARCGVDMLLAGHLHVGHTGSTAARYEIDGHAALVVQAGTATSTRGRGETNSFNVIRIGNTQIVIERHVWSEAERTFLMGTREAFQFRSDGWVGGSGEVV